MTEHGYPATADDVRETLRAAGYQEYEHATQRTASFLVTQSSALARERPGAAGVTVTLDLDADTGKRRVVFAGYATALILAGFHVDYRGHYLYVHGKPRGL